MASKRKERIRRRFEDGWFEVSEDMWREPGEKPLKLRLLADANFPRRLVEVLRKRGLEIRTAQELKIYRFPDEQIPQEAAKRGLFLITLVSRPTYKLTMIVGRAILPAAAFQAAGPA